MNRAMRLYYFGILGGIGGLVGWKISELLGLSFTPNVFLSETVVGGLIGLSIGLFIGLAEGITRNHPWRALQAGGLGALVGFVGGAIGLPIAEGLFLLLGGNIVGSLIGWGLFGLVIGLAVGLKSASQVWKSMLGGALGGVAGGAMLWFIRTRTSNTTLGKALGLVLLGMLTGMFIAFIVWALSRAWLKILNGKMKGSEFVLDKFKKKGFPSILIGSSALKAEIVLPDPDIAPQHAVLTGQGDSFRLRDISLTGTFVNDKKIEEVTLHNMQKIRMGNTLLEYHEKR
jgi:hypothetical protein